MRQKQMKSMVHLKKEHKAKQNNSVYIEPLQAQVENYQGKRNIYDTLTVANKI